jgi:carboxyl-terminal processing protease
MRKGSWLGGFLTGLVAAVIIFMFTGAAVLGTNVQQVTELLKITGLMKLESLEKVSNRQLIEGAMKGMVGSLKDPYSVYMESREYKQLEAHMEGSYGGIGIYVGMRDENRLTIVSPIKGTPGFRAGLQSGDIIVKIDDVETYDMDLDTAVGMMKGQPGTQVMLGIFREGSRELLEMEITREIISIPAVEGKMLENEPEIAYIELLTFSNNTSKEVANLLANLEKKKELRGVILDLRNNPGGSLQAAIEVAQFFVPPGPIVHILDSRNTETISASGGYLDKPLVVLVNKGSASASEILAGAIKDRETGTLVGTKTFGKGLVQSVYQLPRGGALKLTTAKYLTPDRHDINKKGIEPHVEVEQEHDSDHDLQLEKAIEILKTKI